MSFVQKRVLCLHGYSQNASMLSKKLAAVQLQCPDIEMIFFDAPHILQPVDLPAPSQMGYFAGFDSEPPPKEPQRGWWKTQNVHVITAGLEVTLASLKDILKKRGKFDGVLGFSQGAVLAALLSGLLEKPQMYPSFLEDGKALHPPFEFCICVAGYKPLDPLGASLVTPDFKTPTLHILGHNDIVVTPERAQSLIDVSFNGRVEYHDGGHFIPTKTAWRKFLADYIRNPTGDVPSPNGAKHHGSADSRPSTPSTPILD